MRAAQGGRISRPLARGTQISTTGIGADDFPVPEARSGRATVKQRIRIGDLDAGVRSKHGRAICRKVVKPSPRHTSNSLRGTVPMCLATYSHRGRIPFIINAPLSGLAILISKLVPAHPKPGVTHPLRETPLAEATRRAGLRTIRSLSERTRNTD